MLGDIMWYEPTNFTKALRSLTKNRADDITFKGPFKTPDTSCVVIDHDWKSLS